MRIRLATTYAGPAGTYSPGEHDMPAEIAGPLLSAGYASRVDGEQSAADPVPETASQPRRARGKKTTMARGAPETATAPEQHVRG